MTASRYGRARLSLAAFSAAAVLAGAAWLRPGASSEGSIVAADAAIDDVAITTAYTPATITAATQSTAAVTSAAATTAAAAASTTTTSSTSSARTSRGS